MKLNKTMITGTAVLVTAVLVFYFLRPSRAMCFVIGIVAGVGLAWWGESAYKQEKR